MNRKALQLSAGMCAFHKKEYLSAEIHSIALIVITAGDGVSVTCTVHYLL